MSGSIDLKRADRWLRALVYDIENPPGAPALDPVDSEGRYYLKRCKAIIKGKQCPSKLRHPTKSGFYVCGRCGAIWPFHDRYMMKSAVQRSRNIGAAESWFIGRIRTDTPTHGRLRDIFWALNEDENLHWAWRIYVAVASGVVSIREFAANPSLYFPDLNMSKSTVFRRYQQGRGAWGDELRKAGLI